MTLFLAPDAHNNPTIWHGDPDNNPTPVLVRTDANGAGFDALAARVEEAGLREAVERLVAEGFSLRRPYGPRCGECGTRWNAEILPLTTLLAAPPSVPAGSDDYGVSDKAAAAIVGLMLGDAKLRGAGSDTADEPACGSCAVAHPEHGCADVRCSHNCQAEVDEATEVDEPECPTPGCSGDGRYAAPGRGHRDGCTHPVPSPAPADEREELAQAIAARNGADWSFIRDQRRDEYRRMARAVLDSDWLAAHDTALRARNQAIVDHCVAYRNLAIELGATPDQMQNRYDRDLCLHWERYREEANALAADGAPEAWDEVERLSAELAALPARVAEVVEATLPPDRDYAYDENQWHAYCDGWQDARGVLASIARAAAEGGERRD